MTAVVIKASAAAEIQPLIEALCGADDVMREAAAARLAVIGPRAVSSLIHAYRKTAAAATRIAVLCALDAIGDRRSLVVTDDALREGGDVAIAAVAVLRGLLESPQGEAAAAALDRLVATALDQASPPRVRQAAFEALPDPATRTRIARALKSRTGDVLEIGPAEPARPSARDVWADAVNGRLPDDPESLRAIAVERASAASPSTVQALIDRIRGRERDTAAPSARAAWTAVRGTLHRALAERGSRIALYDLRDSLVSPERLPAAFVAALETIGDGPCLEPLAAAFDAASKTDDAWWQDHVAAAFRAIVRREGLTRRHAVIRRVCARWPEAASALLARTPRRAR